MLIRPSGNLNSGQVNCFKLRIPGRYRSNRNVTLNLRNVIKNFKSYPHSKKIPKHNYCVSVSTFDNKSPDCMFPNKYCNNTRIIISKKKTTTNSYQELDS